MNVDVDILVSVSNGAGGVAAVVASVLLHQVGDDDRVGGNLSSWVRLCLLDRFAVVYPRDFRDWSTFSLASYLGSLAFSLVLEFWLDREEGCS